MIYEQSLISKKESVNGFSVERNYINSKEYHDKFEKLSMPEPAILSLIIFQDRDTQVIQALTKMSITQSVPWKTILR